MKTRVPFAKELAVRLRIPGLSGGEFFRAFALAGLLAMPLPLGAQEIADLEVANPTPSGFTVFWTGPDSAEASLEIFSDAGGATDITGTLRIEYFPLAEGDVTVPHGYEERAERRRLSGLMSQNGLFLARVSECDPDTEYHVRARAGTADSDLIAVRTAGETAFVSESRQLVVTFPSGGFDGYAALLATPGARAPLVAVVGDGGLPDRAFFNLSDFVDDATGTNLVPGGELSMSLRVFGPPEPLFSELPPVAFTGEFLVAGASLRDFGGAGPIVAYFTFDPIGDQVAGVPFIVTVHARDVSGAPVADFSGSAVIDSDGDLIDGAGNVSFVGGRVEEHEVTIANTGDFRISASDAFSGAAGESDPFAVRTDWENWLSLKVDPADLPETLREQFRMDPHGSGDSLLMRYAFDFDPPEARPFSFGDVDGENGERYLSISFRRLRYAPDVRYAVLGSDDLTDWETIDVLAPGSPEWVTVRDSRPIGDSERRFMRVGLLGARTFEFWLADEYGPAGLNDPSVGGYDSDPGGFQVTNLERYALGMSGPNPELERLPARYVVTEGGLDYQELRFERLPAGEDVLYIVEATSAYPDWETIASFGPGVPVAMAVRDTEPVPETGYRVIRLRIEPQP